MTFICVTFPPPWFPPTLIVQEPLSLTPTPSKLAGDHILEPSPLDLLGTQRVSVPAALWVAGILISLPQPPTRYQIPDRKALSSPRITPSFLPYPMSIHLPSFLHFFKDLTGKTLCPLITFICVFWWIQFDKLDRISWGVIISFFSEYKLKLGSYFLDWNPSIFVT